MIAVRIIDQIAQPLIFAATIWSWFCIHKGSSQRNAFLAAIAHRPVSGPTLIKHFQAVTYGRHVGALTFFRDPWKLYDPMVRDALDNPIGELPILQVAYSEPGPTISFDQPTKH